MANRPYDKRHLFTFIGRHAFDGLCVYAESRSHADAIYQAAFGYLPLSVRYFVTRLTMTMETNHRLADPTQGHPSLRSAPTR